MKDDIIANTIGEAAYELFRTITEHKIFIAATFFFTTSVSSCQAILNPDLLRAANSIEPTVIVAVVIAMSISLIIRVAFGLSKSGRIDSMRRIGGWIVAHILAYAVVIEFFTLAENVLILRWPWARHLSTLPLVALILIIELLDLLKTIYGKAWLAKAMKQVNIASKIITFFRSPNPENVEKLASDIAGNDKPSASKRASQGMPSVPPKKPQAGSSKKPGS